MPNPGPLLAAAVVSAGALAVGGGPAHAIRSVAETRGSAVERGSVTIISTRTNQVRATATVGRLPGQLAVNSTATVAYVLNAASATVTQVKNGSAVSVRRIRVGEPAWGLVMAPDGASVYVARRPNQPTSNVVPVTARTGRVGHAISLPASGGSITPVMAVTPGGRTVLAAGFGAGARGREAVMPISTGGKTARRPVLFGDVRHSPADMLVTPAGRTAFVLSSPQGPRAGSLVTPVHLPRGKAGESLRLPGSQDAMAMTPDGRFLYLANSAAGVVTVVRTSTDRVVKRIPVSGAFSLAASPDGKAVYVAGSQLGTGVPLAVIISTATKRPSRPIVLDPNGGSVGMPGGVAVTADSRTAYFTMLTAQGVPAVIPMNTATRALGQPIAVGPDPGLLTTTRRGSLLYVVNSANQS